MGDVPLVLSWPWEFGGRVGGKLSLALAEMKSWLISIVSFMSLESILPNQEKTWLHMKSTRD